MVIYRRDKTKFFKPIDFRQAGIMIRYSNILYQFVIAAKGLNYYNGYSIEKNRFKRLKSW